MPQMNLKNRFMEMPHHAKNISLVLFKNGTWCHYSTNNVPAPDNKFYKDDVFVALSAGSPEY